MIDRGTPFPLGVSIKENVINFALASHHAREVSLCLFERSTQQLISEIQLSLETNKTGDIWHLSIQNPGVELLYAYRISPLPGAQPHVEPPFLLDPYAKGVATDNKWHEEKRGKKNGYRPYGEIFNTLDFNWDQDVPPQIPLKDLIIYEMHVRAFTQHPSSQVSHPGTFLGLIEKIPHLLELGINAVELLPVQEFNESEYQLLHPNTPGRLCNFWGYSTVNFFSLMNRYSTSNVQGAVVHEFKTMVKAFHQHGIEVILDVVFNHTAEGGATGSIFSFKGIDHDIYYLLDKQGHYLNFSGCGNTVNANHDRVVEFIISCLRYWVEEMHVDGFRFDLASALTRGVDGVPLKSPPLIEAIINDPILSKVKLIAEPWDAGGLYEVGHFASTNKHWLEWNGKYRDSIRRFIKGSSWASGEFATRLCGSQDLYASRQPCNSINFLTSHDGFSLADLVSYEHKHNMSNGEHNRDGHNDNISWNCGVEGRTSNIKILTLRERQRKNFHLALMLSQGIPMLTMGDEYGHTKEGNNNTWCHDNELNWFLWDELKSHAQFYRFYRLAIAFRKSHPILKRSTFLTNKEIDWHGLEPFKPEWNREIPFIAYTLKDPKHNQDLFVAFNAQNHAQFIHLPPPPYAEHWKWVVNTAAPAPLDIFEDGKGPIQTNNFYRLQAFSAIVLEATF